MKKPLFYLCYKKSSTTVLVAILALGIYSCRTSSNEPVEPGVVSKGVETYDASFAYQWADMNLKLIRASSGFAPPVASRALGYTGLTLYESVVAGMKDNKSLAGQLNGLVSLPKPEDGKEYNWAISANAGQLFMAKNLWPSANDAAKKTVDSLGAAIRATLIANQSNEVIQRSEALGEAIAKAIFEWSKMDGGAEGYAQNFPSDYVVPTGPGKWVTTGANKVPLLPYWGKNRNFIAINKNLTPPQPIPYSTLTSSEQFKQNYEVYTVSQNLTTDQKAIATFWADGGGTFTPPGHSYNIATIALKKTSAKLDKAAETYARVGVAVAEAFINCWRCKYLFNTLRPITYIRTTINPTWSPLVATPPFPEHTSGHSSQSGASYVVLEAMFGENFAFTDNTNTAFGQKERSFTSFKQAAEEAAVSRLYGGIHIRRANESGLVEGSTVGKNVNALAWKK
ncbi:MAG: vanadium-dependent haloperoxidase [Spirosomataceae bacterium]